MASMESPDGQTTPRLEPLEGRSGFAPSTSEQSGRPAHAAPPVRIPVFLRRIIDDHAEQLRRLRGEDLDEADGDAHTKSGPGSVSGSATTAGDSRTTDSRPYGSNGVSTASSSTGSAVEASPTSLSYHSGSSSNSSHGSSAVSAAVYQLPPPMTTPASTASAFALSRVVGGHASAGSATIVGSGRTPTPTSNVGASTSATPAYTSLQKLEAVYQLPKEIAPAEDLLPPENFAMISTFLYRSSFPKKKHFPFMKSLGLKSVLTLILEEYPEQNLEFLESEGIKFYQFGIPGNKEPFVSIPDEKITQALTVLLDVRNHPMLIHCNKGKHRTGCLVGCLRKFQQWSLTAIFDEYRRYSYPKSRSMDQQFIEAFSGLQDVWRTVDRQHLPPWAPASEIDEAEDNVDAAPRTL